MELNVKNGIEKELSDEDEYLQDFKNNEEKKSKNKRKLKQKKKEEKDSIEKLNVENGSIDKEIVDEDDEESTFSSGAKNIEKKLNQIKKKERFVVSKLKIIFNSSGIPKKIKNVKETINFFDQISNI